MKNLSEFENALLDTDNGVRQIGKYLIANMSKLVALFAALIMTAVTFTEISFAGVHTKDALSSLLLLLTSSYIIYFSLEDAGEKHGEDTEEYQAASKRYSKLRESISGSDIEELRNFCSEYSKNELEFRKRSALISHGFSQNDLLRFQNGEIERGHEARILRKINKIKPVIITPRVLLCRERWQKHSELENPEKRKLVGLFVKLIPSTVCMLVTVSVMLTTKDGLTGADVLNGILKLSTLPLIGFRGYSAGYTYAKHSLSLWMETKANILERFISSQSKLSVQATDIRPT